MARRTAARRGEPPWTMKATLRLAACAVALTALGFAPARAHEVASCGGTSPLESGCAMPFLAPGGQLAITTTVTPGYLGWVHAEVRSSAGSWMRLSCEYAGVPTVAPVCAWEGWGPPFNPNEPVVLTGWVDGVLQTRSGGLGRWTVGVLD